MLHKAVEVEEAEGTLQRIHGSFSLTNLIEVEGIGQHLRAGQSPVAELIDRTG